MLIEMEKLAAAAESRGFRVQRGARCVELWEPNSAKPSGVWWDGSVYSTCDVLLDSTPSLDYGYNGAFYGPYHYGYCAADSFGARKLLNHPAMAGVTI